MNSFLFDSNCKGHFSGHETFPLRQLWLAKAYNEVSNFPGRASKKIFTDSDAIVRFGVGKNMVSSIRHWAMACDIIKLTEDGYETTKIGDVIFGKNGLDPYNEHDTTLWLIHWMLAGRGERRSLRSTTWAWLFSYVVESNFESKHIYDALLQYKEEMELKTSSNSIQRDIEVCMRSYVPKASSASPEDISEPILGELGLLISDTKNTYRFRRGEKSTLHVGLFGFALLEYWDISSPNVNTLSFDSIAHDYGAPGRVFKLDENSVADYIIELEILTQEKFVWSDSAGIRQVIRKDDYPDKYKLLEYAYE